MAKTVTATYSGEELNVTFSGFAHYDKDTGQSWVDDIRIEGITILGETLLTSKLTEKLEAVILSLADDLEEWQ